MASPCCEGSRNSGPGGNYVRRLLAGSPVDRTGGRAPGGPASVETLSDRELDVLRLLGTDLDGPDIARNSRCQ